MRHFGTTARVFAMAVLLPALAAAQNDNVGQTELQRTQRSLQQNRAEIERLIEMRLRHDLGLGSATPADAQDRTFRPAAPASTETMERMQQELREEDAATASMQERYTKLAAAVAQLRADAGARGRNDTGAGPGVVVPAPGRLQPAAPARAQHPDAPPAPAGETAETAPHPVPVDPVASALDPVLAQIHGSTDHQRVATALFRAGQALMDRAHDAREHGQDAAAKDFDNRGKERLRRVLDELAPLLAAKQPPLDALFCQGKSLELLFRCSERNEGLSNSASARDWQRREQEVRDAFLKITVRDVTKSGARGEVEVLGSWGQAAQAALEHFRWMNLNAGYDATASIRALTWPGADAQ